GAVKSEEFTGEYQHNRAAFSPNGKLIASKWSDKSLRVFDGVTVTELANLGERALIAFSPDSSYVLCGSADGRLWLMDALTGAEFKTLKGDTSNLRDCLLSPDGARIAGECEDQTLILWYACTGVVCATLTRTAVCMQC